MTCFKLIPGSGRKRILKPRTRRAKGIPNVIRGRSEHGSPSDPASEAESSWDCARLLAHPVETLAAGAGDYSTIVARRDFLDLGGVCNPL